MNTQRWSLRMSGSLYDELHAHLFPGDGDEHGAVIEAGVADLGGKKLLLARRLIKAREGIDWVPGKRGYRMLTAAFVTGNVRVCRDQKLVYLAVHNHGGRGEVGFSGVDLQTHERGFPALLDIMKDIPVGALVFAEDCVAGDIWTPDGKRHVLQDATAIGPGRRRLTPKRHTQTTHADPRYDRQVRLFGDRGQTVFAQARVAIVGLGGVGILLAEYLGRLGVGHFVLVDPDRIRTINLPRMVDATEFDALSWLTADTRPAWLRALGRRFATPKVALARRIIRKANRKAQVAPFQTEIEDPEALEAVKNCDYIFLAADSHRARLILNAMAHQYLIPVSQLGARIRSNQQTGDVEHVHTVVRWVLPDRGCLACNSAINPARLQEESLSSVMRDRQKYTDDPDIVAPSVITLNAETASQAANDFLFYMTGMARPGAFGGYVRTHPLDRKLETLLPRKDINCTECGLAVGSRFAQGDRIPLPLVD